MKRLKILFLLILCGISFSVKASAKVLISVNTANFPIRINCENINTETANKMLYYDYPMFLYKDITYFPLSYYNCVLAGVGVSLENNVVTVEKTFPADALKFKSERLGETVFRKSFEVKKSPFKVLFDGKEYKNEDYPVLFYKDIIYIPLTWQVVNEIFGWEISFDNGKMELYTQSYYYTSSGDSYFNDNGEYTGFTVQPGKTYYCRDGVRIIAETFSNRLGPNSGNLSVTKNGKEYVVSGYTGHFQREGALFRVDGNDIYTVHYAQKPDENKACRINIETGEISYNEQ